MHAAAQGPLVATIQHAIQRIYVQSCTMQRSNSTASQKGATMALQRAGFTS
jgi:hypothetical protein